MRAVLQLLTLKSVFLIALLVPFGIMQELGVDARLTMLCAGLVFLGSGLGQFQNAKEDGNRKGLTKAIGWFFTVFAVFIMFMSVFMFVSGQEIQIS